MYQARERWEAGTAAANHRNAIPCGMAIFDVPKRFSRQWVQRKVPQMDSTEFHAMFHEAATRGWDEDELRQLARMWADESGSTELASSSDR
jgi:hypothetical protein